MLFVAAADRPASRRSLERAPYADLRPEGRSGPGALVNTTHRSATPDDYLRPARLGPQDRLRVAIVEDEDLYRDLLRVALSEHERLEVVGAFRDSPSALEGVPRLKPNAVILDIELRSEMNGVQLGMALRERLPGLGIVLLSNHADLHILSSVPEGTVTGWSYLLKKSVSDVQALGRAIEGAAAGFVVLDPQLARDARPRAGSILSRLTPRQREVLDLIAQGFSNAAIAERLVLSVKSVENQINLLYQQMDITRENPSVQPRVKAVLTYFHESRLLPQGDISTTR